MDKKNIWQNVLIDANTTVLAAMQLMNTEGLRVLLVVTKSQQLLGIITDGDIRRYLLTQASLNESVNKVMNKKPVTASITDNHNQLLMKMHSLGILHLPIIDNENRVVGLKVMDNLIANETKDNVVIFMAGGLGKRLHPLTVDCPKPLLKIGKKPISEILLENFVDSGFKNYYFSVNYKSEMIRQYFGAGHRWGVDIQYIQEKSALGTAGSLSLLPTIPKKPFFVVNADILTKINFSYLLEYHQDHNALATVCVREYQNTIPFGVVHMDQECRFIKIQEKPTNNYFVNAGIYILEPEVMQHLPFNSYCDMPNFLTELAKQGCNIATFPIHEYWIDVGRHDELEKAVQDYSEIF